MRTLLDLSAWAGEYRACAPRRDHYRSCVLSSSMLARASSSRHALLVAAVSDGQSLPFSDLTLSRDLPVDVDFSRRHLTLKFRSISGRLLYIIF